MALIYAQKRPFDTYEGMLEDGMVSRRRRVREG